MPGVSTAILLEGINDIGNNAGTGGSALTAQQLESGYQTVIQPGPRPGGPRSTARHTILPYQGSGYYSANGEKIDPPRREPLDPSSGAFDAVIDMDAAVRDPADPAGSYPSYDSGDHLHPNARGYARMGAAVPLSLLGSARCGR